MIRRLYQDPGLRQRLGENAARTAGRYTWERHVDQMRALFEQAMAGNASKTAASRES
jgi:glycosyltransferase involved in cell wall biosynthesis